MRVAFVDHVDHDRDGSSRFAREIVARLGEMTVLVTPADGTAADDAVAEAFISGAHDHWVFFGTDNVATRLVPLGLRGAVLVPMLDRVHSAPPAYFQQFVLSRFAVFSFELHRRLQTLGCRSAVFGPWPEPPPLSAEPRGDRASWAASFRELRADEVPHAASVIAQCGRLGIPRLHIRRTPVAGDDAALVQLGRECAVTVTTSDEPENRSDAGALGREAQTQFIFASSPYDGLGLAIRAAMAAGKVVIAPDLAVANECIGHLASGVLYDLERPLDLPRLSPDSVARMSQAARLKARIGRTRWEEDAERFASYLIDEDRRWSAGDGSARFLNEVRRRAHARATVGSGK